MPYVMKTIRVPGHYKIVGRKKIWVRGYAKRVRVYVPPKRRH